ncbi:hypothetical protein ACLOAV_004892 [Pseudogymnoascus australis]
MNAQPTGVYSTYKTYSAQLLTWDSSFSNFMSLKSHTLTALQIRGAALLKIHHTTATIMGRSIPELTDPRSISIAANDPMVFARYTDEFQTVRKRTAGRGLTFSTDMGVVAPLYYVCIKCADVSLREQAIELLSRCPRREGMWDSALGVRMIREFWEMEEAYRVLPQGAVKLVLEADGRWEWTLRDGDTRGEGRSAGCGVKGTLKSCNVLYQP